mgnify:CR=1 FL=1
MTETLHIIGGGLAGSEAAWQAAKIGINVVLHEMRPIQNTEVHKTQTLAELVCSNSFRSDDHLTNAVGVLHQEMRMMDSLIMRIADLHKVPAGGALAVDRELFSKEVELALNSHPKITIKREEVLSLDKPDWSQIIVATGPLTAMQLAEEIKKKTGEKELAFFDAIAPIVYFESINMDIAWFQSRYDKGEGKDYINCPMNKSQYEAFVQALNAGEKMLFREWEKNTPYFNGCMPIEIMASRGLDTLRFGPMKPVGLKNSHDNSSPFAVVQLRQDNKLGSLFNIVGFQTKLKYAEQTRIFRMIPGLENAEFARLGGLHRNTFINSPHILDNQLRLKTEPKIRFAGQITGVEGYVESAAIGGMAGKMAAYEIINKRWIPPPEDTAHGALLSHLISGAIGESFQPMNINFGLFPPLTIKNKNNKRLKGRERKVAYASRSLASMEKFLKSKN